MTQMAFALGTHVATSWRRAATFIELTKPRVSSLVLVTTAVGYWLGMSSVKQLAGLPAVLIGAGLAAAGANTLNQWMERDVDARMQRTATRPLPSGRLSSDAAFRFGALLSVLGILVLAGAVNALAAILGALTIGLYLAVYTPLKRRTFFCTLIGAVPGALPPLIGWAGARQTLGPEAWALFLLLFVWQLPHFLAIAELYRDDYARAGLRMLPLLDPGGETAARHMVLYSLLLIPVSLLPVVVGMGGRVYFTGALLLGLAFFGVVLRAAWIRSPVTTRHVFLASILYLPLVLGLLVADTSFG